MDWTQAITIIVTILVPMLVGFGWMIHQIGSLNVRLTALEMRLGYIERMFEMMGSLFKFKKIDEEKNG